MTSTSPVDFAASLATIGNATSAQAHAALKSKAKGAAQNFESMFLSNMFSKCSLASTATGRSAAAAR